MGINARLRYAISWLVIKTILPVTSWTAAGLMWLNIGIAMGAFWFSPELHVREAKRMLESIDE